jgi:hypothetical protein
MERREREAILWEGVPRRDVRHERSEREAHEHVADSPLAGRPLRRRYRNWQLAADSYLLSMGGPLPWMQRLRLIEDLTADHLRRLEEAYAEHAGDPQGWERTVRGWDFYAVNELIDKHNRYFPIEARLPMDPKTRDFVLVNGRPYRRELLDAAWALERLPSEALRVDVDDDGQARAAHRGRGG